MRLGAGRATLDFPEGFLPMEGFARVVHPLHARVLILGENCPFVLLSLELTSLPDDEVACLKSLLAEQCHTCAERVWICVTHTFSAPHFASSAQNKAKSHTRRLDKAVCAGRLFTEPIFPTEKSAS